MPISGRAMSRCSPRPWAAASVRVRERARFRFLSQEDIVAAGGLDVAATIEVVEEALRLHGATRGSRRSRPVVGRARERRDGRPHHGDARVCRRVGRARASSGCDVPSNPSRGLPRASGWSCSPIRDRSAGGRDGRDDGLGRPDRRRDRRDRAASGQARHPRRRDARRRGAGADAARGARGRPAQLDEVRVWDIAPERARRSADVPTRSSRSRAPRGVQERT
jgi:hypothetical protein